MDTTVGHSENGLNGFQRYGLEARMLIERTPRPGALVARMLVALVLLGGFAANTVYAAAAPPPAGDDEELDAVHHIADGYYLDFSPIPKIELPRIFIIRDESGSLGIEFFRSTTAAIASGRYDVVFEDDHAGGDDHAESDDHAGEDDHAAEDDHAEDAAAPGAADHDAGDDEHAEAAGGHSSPLDGTLVRRSGEVVLDMSISRHLVFVWIVSLLLIWVALWLAGRYRRGVGRESAPKGGLQNTMEALITYVRDEIAGPNIGPRSERYVPFLLTLWFFILFANLIGLLPLSVTSTANITITGVLAIFTFVVVQISGTKDYWMHILWPPGIPWFVKPILVPIEFLGIFIKPFVLAVRLFANMTAGHLVLLSLLGLGFTLKSVYGPTGGYIGAGAGVLFALFIYLIEVLVAFLQAYIFVMLSALYIGAAVEEHEHHHDEAHAGHDAHALALDD